VETKFGRVDAGDIVTVAVDVLTGDQEAQLYPLRTAVKVFMKLYSEIIF